MIHVYKNKEEFLDANLQFLQEDEIKNNLIIGIASRGTDLKSFFVSSQIGENKLLGVISGKNMILSANNLDIDTYKDLVEFMEDHDYPGIVGPKDECELYSKIYQKVTSKEMVLEMDQRIYSCKKINHISEEIGLFRLASFDDYDILLDWVYEFQLMIETNVNKEDLKERLTERIENKTIYVLEVKKELVSMAARSRPLSISETVSLVYTPNDKRQKGYATRVVELLTEVILKNGKIATLYTDLANPTSNSIYMKIGYNPHCDSVMYKRS